MRGNIKVAFCIRALFPSPPPPPLAWFFCNVGCAAGLEGRRLLSVVGGTTTLAFWRWKSRDFQIVLSSGRDIRIKITYYVQVK